MLSVDCLVAALAAAFSRARACSTTNFIVVALVAAGMAVAVEAAAKGGESRLGGCVAVATAHKYAAAE